MGHFIAVAGMAGGSSPDKTLQDVMGRIDRVFGDEDIPNSLEWEDRIKFTHVADLIEDMVKRGMYDEAIQAAERCFEHVENLAGVHWPDDFLECYEPIIRAWIIALHGSKVPTSSLAQQVTYLEVSDRYGAFFGLEKRFADELGPDVIGELKKELKRR
jgi:hypothetical protein